MSPCLCGSIFLIISGSYFGRILNWNKVTRDEC